MIGTRLGSRRLRPAALRVMLFGRRSGGGGGGSEPRDGRHAEHLRRRPPEVAHVEARPVRRRRAVRGRRARAAEAAAAVVAAAAARLARASDRGRSGSHDDNDAITHGDCSNPPHHTCVK